jgi:hypothetical protein
MLAPARLEMEDEMAKRKDMAGKDDEREVRGRPGPPTATKNEKAQGRTRKGGDASRGVPKVGKHDSTGDDSGGGLH